VLRLKSITPVSPTSPQQVGSFTIYGKVQGKCVYGFWALANCYTKSFKSNGAAHLSFY